MSQPLYSFGACVNRAALILLSFGIFLASTADCLAQSPIVRVEEDWELVLGAPDPGSDSPQITTVLSPYLQRPGSTHVVPDEP